MGRNVVLSTGSTVLAIVATVVGVVALATPYWATFENRTGSEDGHFGLWTVCKRSRRDVRCGSYVSRLQPSEYTTAAGVCGAIAVLVSVGVCAMSPLVLAMRVTRRQVMVKFRTAIVAKLIVSCMGAVSGILSLVLFSIEMDAKRLGENVGFQVTRSWSFAMMVVFLLLMMGLVALSAVEFVLARRLGGDPVKMARDPSGTLAPVIGNPGARDGVRVSSSTANGVTVIHAAQSQPQPGVVHARPGQRRTAAHAPQQWPTAGKTNGQSQNPPPRMPTSSYNGKPIPFDPGKSPLRSSMKKKRQQKKLPDDSAESSVTIIPNPAAGSPPRGKKVRINTLDTAV